MPTVPTISLLDAPGSACSPIAVTAFDCTGPPMWSMCSPPISSPSSGAASPTVVSDGRFSTSPKAPSVVCSTTSTTARRKKSAMLGDAISSCPLRLSATPKA